MVGVEGQDKRRRPIAQRIPRLGGLLALVAVGVLLGSAGNASAVQPPPHTPASASAPAGSFHDRVIPGRLDARLDSDSTIRARSAGEGNGGFARLQAAPQYAGGLVAQRVTTTLESLLHGEEMERLSVYIASSGDLSRLCGPGASACYYAGDETMVVPGEPVNSPMPLEMLVAHEYGHHLAGARAGFGWPASTWGAKHWATYEGVCQGLRTGQLYEGTGGVRYWDQPGEAFAQAYAFYHYRDEVPWWWSFAEPNEGAFAAIRDDVVTSSHPRNSTLSARLSGTADGSSQPLSTPLDGRLRLRLEGGPSGRYALVLRSPEGTVLKATRWRTRPRLRYLVCGARSFTVEVRRRSGAKRIELKIRQP
jgi:hypothetical protein